MRFQLCELDVFDERQELNDALQKVGLCFELEGRTKFQTHPEVSGERDISCQSFSWEALNCVDQEFEVAFSMNDSRWYGASQVHEQLWPIDQWTLPYHQFINTLSVRDEFGGVMHRYFLSSSGTAITVEWDVPLWVSFNHSGDSTDAPHPSTSRPSTRTRATTCTSPNSVNVAVPTRNGMRNGTGRWNASAVSTSVRGASSRVGMRAAA